MARATAVPAAVADAPVIEPKGLTEEAFERSVILGAVVGTVVLIALTFGLALLGGLDVGTAAAVAPWPGLVCGVFFGGNAFLGRAMYKADH
jgi:hypothetical protein